MSVKNSLLLTCAVVAVTVVVRTQASPASEQAGPAPATLFGDVARSPEPMPGRAPTRTNPSPVVASVASPFVLNAPKPVARSGTGEGSPHGDAIDLSALRYFAAQNDLGRVSAEIRLLRAKHPDWEPPQDLFSEGGSGVDEQPLWDLLARRDFSAIQARMDDIRRDKPDWQPTNDFAGKLALAGAHDTLSKASDAKQWGTVIDTAVATPALLTCGDVDALWRTAEALVRTGDEPRAVAAYRYVLSNCTPADVRLATVQKASLLTSSETLDGLLQLGHRAPDGRGEFDQLKLDRFRRAIGDATANAGSVQPTPEEIAAVTASATGPTGQSDAQLLGWYARSRKDYAGAERWFRAALAAGPNAKAAEGLVLALRDAGNMPDATKLAFQYASLDPLNRKLMVEVAAAGLSDPKAAPLTHDEMMALTDATDAARSADGAQALGWHLYKANDVAGAEGWFRKSADWQASESAAVGLVVTARRLHHDRDYAARIAEYRTTYPRVAELEALMRSRPAPRQAVKAVAQARHATGKPVRVASAPRGERTASAGTWDKSADEIVKANNAGDYDSAVRMLEQRRLTHAEPRGLSVVRGWALYHKGDWEGAKQVFSKLDNGAYSPERVDGLRVIEQSYTPAHFK